MEAQACPRIWEEPAEERKDNMKRTFIYFFTIYLSATSRTTKLPPLLMRFQSIVYIVKDADSLPLEIS